jgi:hypothetical protein
MENSFPNGSHGPNSTQANWLWIEKTDPAHEKKTLGSLSEYYFTPSPRAMDDSMPGRDKSSWIYSLDQQSEEKSSFNFTGGPAQPHQQSTGQRPLEGSTQLVTLD